MPLWVETQEKAKPPTLLGRRLILKKLINMFWLFATLMPHSFALSPFASVGVLASIKMNALLVG